MPSPKLHLTKKAHRKPTVTTTHSPPKHNEINPRPFARFVTKYPFRLAFNAAQDSAELLEKF